MVNRFLVFYLLVNDNPPMNAAEKEIENRRAQLRKWIATHFKNTAAFVAKHNLNQGEISGLLNKKSFGSRKARLLEEATGMPERYLEQISEPVQTQNPGANGAGSGNVLPGPDIQGRVPVVSWIQAGEWGEIVGGFAATDAEEWLPCPRSHGPNTFALRVQGSSMEPKFQAGDIIFVDPSAEALHGKNVVVRLENEQTATFKQLVIEDGQMFLRPLNPDWPEKMIRVTSAATFCGVVIGKFVSE